MNNPLISIIIPCYNAASYIAETLESVIMQAYTNWECIIVDDHSTDNSWEIIQCYQQCYPKKIFSYKNPRKGACAARNIGMDYAKGEYIQFLDADDVLPKNKLEEQINILKNYPNSIVYCDSISFSEKKELDKIVLSKVDKNITCFSPLDFFLKEINVYPHCWLIHNVIAKKHIWDEAILLNQDGEYFYRVLRDLENIIYTPNTVCYYRISNLNSISRSITEEKLLSGYKTIHTFRDSMLYLSSAQTEKKIFQCIGNKYLYYLFQSFPKYPIVYAEISKNPFIKYASAKYRTNKTFNDLIIKLIGWRFYKQLLKLKI